MRIRPCLLAIAILASPMVAFAEGWPPGAQAPAAIGNQATRLVDAFHDAMRRGDLAAAAEMIADDAVVYEHGGVEHSKAEYLTEHLPADIAYSHGMTDEIVSRISSVNGKVAWVITEGRTHGTYDGKPVDRLTTETMILKRTGSGWKIVHVHWSSAKAPAPTP